MLRKLEYIIERWIIKRKKKKRKKRWKKGQNGQFFEKKIIKNDDNN